MDTFIYSLNVVVPVFLLVAIGYTLRRVGLVNENYVEISNKVVFNLALPLSIFKSTYTSDLRQLFDLKLVLFCVFAIVLVALVLFLVLPRFVKDRAVCATMVQGMFRSNFLLLGIPLVVNMFGEQNAAPATLVMPFAITTYNLTAVLIFAFMVPDTDGGTRAKVNWKKTLLNIIKNPLIIASVLGMVVSLLQWRFPVMIEKTISDIAGMATPLALLTLGGQFNVHRAIGNLKRSMASVAVRLVVIPLTVVTVAVCMGFRGSELGTVFVLFSAPSAVSSYVMAKNMGGDGELAAQIVLFTTFFSVFTLLAGTFVLKAFSLI